MAKTTNGKARTRRTNTKTPTPQLRPTEEEIRIRAYAIYLQRGGTHGHDFDDWLEAERELVGPGSVSA
jgi:Protein of unknown function (DUF2934)